MAAGEGPDLDRRAAALGLGPHFPSDVWPIRQATRVLPVILEDALPNLVRSPGSVVRVANMARRADLRPELEASAVASRSR